MFDIFIATVWPFAESRIDEICKVIEQKFHIHKVEKFEFDISWPEMVEVVYASDSIKSAKLLPKVDVLSKYPKYVVLVYIEVEDPEYYIKDDGRTMSGSMVALKREVRAKFGPKKEADKNPFHIPDNKIHSKLYEKALEVLGK